MSMPEAAPNLIVIAGPNGAGKSTVAPLLLKEALGIDEFVNADVIAQGLSAFNPQSTAIEAGKIMLKRLHRLAEQKKNFAFETTLASRSFCPWIAQLQEQGYRFHLLYLWLPSPELAIARVKERVAMGGHDVPGDVILRRYEAGLENLFNLYVPIADGWRLVGNINAIDRYAEKKVIQTDLEFGVSDCGKSKSQYHEMHSVAKSHCTNFNDTEHILAALNHAVLNAVLQHKRAGNPIATWRDGKVVWIPAEEIEVEEESANLPFIAKKP